MCASDLVTALRRLSPAAAALVMTGVAWAYAVGPPLTMDKLTAEADLVFKGTVLSAEPVQDEWFKPCPGFTARETAFKVISVIKGDAPVATLRFRHYDQDPRPQGYMFQPQYYHFEKGRSYIVFAKRSESAGVFRQLQANQTGKEDQGVLLCPGDQPVTAKTVKEAIWGELTLMLKSADATNLTYAIHQLDQMSGRQDSFRDTQDFDRTNVLNAIHGLITNSNPMVAQAALGAVGSHNPYLSDERTIFWLATVGSGEIPGLGKMDPKMSNLGGKRFWMDLVTLADSKAVNETRAMAIQALGLVREPSLKPAIERWLADPDPAIRASAALLLADFPGTETCEHLATLAGDPAPEVRACMARAAGFGQQVDAVVTLATLLADKETKVRTAAAMSLLSFSPKDNAIAAVFRANLENEEFKPLFLIALARENPVPYLDALATAVEQRSEPKNWWGGQIPAFAAWEILFRYLQPQSPQTLRSGKLDRYLDAIEKVGNYSSSEPRDIYAFYVQRDMTERAQKYRQAAKKAVSYDLDYYFKQVDANPSLYKRQ
jgi:HEAT repeat protein